MIEDPINPLSYLGFIPFVPALLSDLSKIALKAADGVSIWNPTRKHFKNAGGNWAKFNTDDVGQIRNMVQEILRSENSIFKANPQSPNTFRVEGDLGREVGTKGQTKIRVILGEDGGIITAFPIN